MRIGLIGSVSSSLITLQKLIEYRFDIVGVWGYEPQSSKNVSDLTSLKELSLSNNLSYHPFEKVNDSKVKEELRKAKPEMLFIIGLSQLVDDEIIQIPPKGCVGFHPTSLPRGRGRAPIAWLVLKENEGAANFFKIENDADSGDIYVQEKFEISSTDDADIVGRKSLVAIEKALDRWLPKLAKGDVSCQPQDNRKATYYARRAPLDGIIDWYNNAAVIDRLIKATSQPHPGAYTFYGDYRVVIWTSNYYHNGFPIGVVGRVVDMLDGHPVIQTGNGYVELIKYEMFDNSDNSINKELVIGSRLGYYDQYEIFKLRNEIKKIKEHIGIL